MVTFRHDRLVVERSDWTLTIRTYYRPERTTEEADLRMLADLLLPGEAYVGEERPRGWVFTMHCADRFLFLADPRIGLNGRVEESVPVVLVHPADPRSVLILRNVGEPDNECLEITLHGAWIDQTVAFAMCMELVEDR